MPDYKRKTHGRDPACIANDQRIAALARQRLGESGYSPLTRLGCEWSQGVITLTGNVSSYYMKQKAIALVRSIDSVTEVNDLIEVIR